VEAAAHFHEFGELDMPRFQVGFPPQHLCSCLGDYWSGRRESLPSAVGRPARRARRQPLRKPLSRPSTGAAGAPDGRNTFYRVADGSRHLLPYGPTSTPGAGNRGRRGTA
jgi:phenylacetic acid degradation operon negative regulatory protein